MSSINRLGAAVFALAALGTLLATARAQPSGGPYVIDPTTIAGGGATLSGGQFGLSGTIGQPATARLTAYTYQLYGGFLTPLSDRIFASGFDQ